MDLHYSQHMHSRHLENLPNPMTEITKVSIGE